MSSVPIAAPRSFSLPPWLPNQVAPPLSIQQLCRALVLAAAATRNQRRNLKRKRRELQKLRKEDGLRERKMAAEIKEENAEER
jgi:hypothetical protein